MAAKNLRFGARSADGRRSSVWFVSRTGSDIYVGVRSFGDRFKLSLHKDGRAQISLTSEHYPRLRDEGVPSPPSRHFTRWRMPDVPDAGAVHVASVIFPSRFLTPRPQLMLNKPVRWEPAPEEGALELGLFYGGRMTNFEPGVRLRFATRLSDGRVVMIAVRSTDFDGGKVLEQLSGPHRYYALSGELWNASPGDAIPDCAAFVWSEVRDGQAVVIWEITGLSIQRN
jgi:hypothetical protein